MGQGLGKNCISDTNQHHPQPAKPMGMQILAIFILVLDAGISINCISSRQRKSREHHATPRLFLTSLPSAGSLIGANQVTSLICSKLTVTSYASISDLFILASAAGKSSDRRHWQGHFLFCNRKRPDHEIQCNSNTPTPSSSLADT